MKPILVGLFIGYFVILVEYFRLKKMVLKYEAKIRQMSIEHNNEVTELGNKYDADLMHLQRKIDDLFVRKARENPDQAIIVAVPTGGYRNPFKGNLH
jgi:hypothetical protein